MFDEERMAKDVREFSFPRLVGSPGELRARQTCLERLREAGLQPVEEEFAFSTFFARFWVRGSMALLAALLVLYSVRDLAEVLAVAFRWYGFVLFAYYSIVLLVFRDPTHFRPRNRRSANILAKLPPKGDPAGIVVVSAHYDSKSQRLTIFWRAFLAIFVVALGVPTTALIVAREALASEGHPAAGPLLVAVRILVVPLTCAQITLAINKIGNKSPGAADDASGMACVFELARHYAKNPLQHHEVWFVLFGAEELGTMGSRFFLLRHLRELRPRRAVRPSKKDPRRGSWNSFNVNFDTIFDSVKIIKERKIFRKYVYARLADAYREACRELGYPVETFYLGPGASTDRKNFDKAHVEVLDVCDWTGSRVAHSPRDVPENVKPHLLRQACEVVHGVLERIDAGRLRPKHPYWSRVINRAPRNASVVASPASKRAWRTLPPSCGC